MLNTSETSRQISLVRVCIVSNFLPNLPLQLDGKRRTGWAQWMRRVEAARVREPDTAIADLKGRALATSTCRVVDCSSNTSQQTSQQLRRHEFDVSDAAKSDRCSCEIYPVKRDTAAPAS